MRTPPRKPTGEVGPFSLTFNGGTAVVQSHFIQFPPTKEAVEDLVAEGFLAQARREAILPTSSRIHRNAVDDFDFTLETPSSLRYLELMEVAPLEAAGGSHHATTGSFRPYDLARGAMDKLQQKSNRYFGVARSTRIVLLLYITHWTFTPNDTTIMLLQYWCHHEAHCFDEVYFYQPHDNTCGMLSVLHPTPKQHWQQCGGFDPEDCRQDVMHNLVPVAVQTDDRGHPGIVMGTAARGVSKLK